MKLSARDRTHLAAIRELYARLPEVRCKGECGLACGPIVFTDLEGRAMQQAGGKKPRTIPITLADGRTIERCTYLEGNRCTVYAVRPLICRTWGVVRMLSCFRGCLPDRWLDDPEFVTIAQAIERLGGGRTIVTGTEGMADLGPAFGQFGTPTRSAEAMRADGERTRNLRALFGGRIMYARSEEE